MLSYLHDSSGPPRLHPASLIIEGHAGSGKTTVARCLCATGVYRYVKPFDGEVGQLNRWLFEQGRTDDLLQFRRLVIDRCLDRHAATPAVFDRLHVSTLSLVDPSAWPADLPDRSRTVILWCDEAVTQSRLNERGRDVWSPALHARFVSTFRQIAEVYDIPLVDTGRSTPEAVAGQILRRFSVKG